MNKKILFLLSFLFFPFNAFALSFNDCNDVSHDVIDYGTLRDYCYFTYFDETSDNSLIVYNRNFESACVIGEPNTTFVYDTDENRLFSRPVGTAKYKYYQFYNLDSLTTDCVDSCSNNFIFPSFSFSTMTINKTDNTLKFESNFTIQDIKTKYDCSSSVEPDEPTPDEPTPDEDQQSITQNDFYLLLFLLSTLIWLLYFKWCFPFTKGRDLS